MKNRLNRLAPGYTTMAILYFTLGNLCLIFLDKVLFGYNTSLLGLLTNVLFLNVITMLCAVVGMLVQL